MSRSKKLNILLPIISLLFMGAFAKHRLLDKQDITGTLNNKEMDETSGIAASSINPDTYYVHNDSGDTSRFFAISSGGKLKSTIYFKGDSIHQLGVQDCEDIDVGPGPEKGKSYVYIGDIGDNAQNRPFITIYRAIEKKSWATDNTANVNTPVASANFKYPDGPKDAETLMIDPIDKQLIIVSKRGDTVGVYTTPLNYKANTTTVLTKRCKLFFSGFKPFKWITAGDISKDGQQILLKSYDKVYYWRRQHNEPIWETMVRQPRELEYKVEKQGEAIGFQPDGKGYYTTSEGVFAPIYHYDVPN
ncbi:hypothetical protein [Mucilaginibacter rubeus]|uniref:WD40 repeat domain-containing protein n=1 Tax=Mucilaginibacter rubeus TaxID=2027860 RepID=A0A5C1I083_9SPHI|nr:hypothetical protein [Mucilaginibacter rubeus]QEM11557.1 hypothetical protein DEO27_016495 [Mucilaginibacter rubeus]